MTDTKRSNNDGWQPVDKGYQPTERPQPSNPQHGYQPPSQNQPPQHIAPPPKKR